MKHKVAELEGALLDWAVGKADGLQLHDPGGFYMHPEGWPHEGKGEPLPWSPSTLWEVGGPIIERERIDISAPEEWSDDERWYAGMYQGKDAQHSHMKHEARGATPLIAAMRAYVASKFGEEIELP
jgi:hypothetical protein